MATPGGVLQNRRVLYLVDASVFIFRAYYSVPLEFTDREGNPVNAVHGFARFLGDLIERVSPERLAVAFDEVPQAQGLAKVDLPDHDLSVALEKA